MPSSCVHSGVSGADGANAPGAVAVASEKERERASHFPKLVNLRITNQNATVLRVFKKKLPREGSPLKHSRADWRHVQLIFNGPPGVPGRNAPFPVMQVGKKEKDPAPPPLVGDRIVQTGRNTKAFTGKKKSVARMIASITEERPGANGPLAVPHVDRVLPRGLKSAKAELLERLCPLTTVILTSLH